MRTITVIVNRCEDDEHELKLPAKWEICGSCDGNGTELYGSLKGADVTEMCHDDPDFEEEYHGGRYDVPCSSCKGSGKVLVVDEGRLTPDQRKAYEAHCEYLCECARDAYNDARTRRQENGGY